MALLHLLGLITSNRNLSIDSFPDSKLKLTTISAFHHHLRKTNLVKMLDMLSDF